MVAAAATFCVCMKIHSGKTTLSDISLIPQRSAARNMIFFLTTTSSPKSTTAVVHFLIILRHVQSATCHIGQQSSWFQQEHSVRTAGPKSTVDIWWQSFPVTMAYLREDAAATSVWTRHRKLQLAEWNKTMRWCTQLKSTVDRYDAQCTSMKESWPASFVPNDEFWTLDIEWTLHGKLRTPLRHNVWLRT